MGMNHKGTWFEPVIVIGLLVGFCLLLASLSGVAIAIASLLIGAV